VCDCDQCLTGYYPTYTFTIPAGTVLDNIPPCDCSVFNGSFTLHYSGSCTWSSTALVTDDSCGGTVGEPLWKLKRVSAFFSLANSDGTLEFDQTALTNCTDAFAVEAGPESFGACRINVITDVTVTPSGTFVTCPPPPMMLGVAAPVGPKRSVAQQPCVRLGSDTGQTETCKPCRGGAGIELKVFSCSEFGRCTIAKSVPGVACCNGCHGYLAARPKL
jgi:hypothetical protein